jgi:hypothetical protein
VSTIKPSAPQTEPPRFPGGVPWSVPYRHAGGMWRRRAAVQPQVVVRCARQGGVLNVVRTAIVSALKAAGGRMNLLLVGCLSVSMPLAALGLSQLQASLERWDQKRHAED